MYPMECSGTGALQNESRVMAEFERLVEAYTRRASACPGSKLDLLMDLARICDRRVLPFLLKVMANADEAEEVRIYVLKQLRNGGGLVAPADRPVVARLIGDILADGSTPDLRLEAALALGEFVQIDGVLPNLSVVCLAHEESIDLRYAAFTSLERAAPTPECIALLRRLSNDETLGDSARSVLSAWHTD